MTPSRGTPAVLHYKDGVTEHVALPLEIDPAAETLVVIREDNSMEYVPFLGLKAVFFLHGDNEPELIHQPASGEGGILVVEFQDGEAIRGTSPDYSPQKRGFLLFPLDRSKNERIFVVNSAVSSIEIEKF